MKKENYMERKKKHGRQREEDREENEDDKHRHTSKKRSKERKRRKREKQAEEDGRAASVDTADTKKVKRVAARLFDAINRCCSDASSSSGKSAALHDLRYYIDRLRVYDAGPFIFVRAHVGPDLTTGQIPR